MPTLAEMYIRMKSIRKEHEFQVIGLIPIRRNTITFYITNEDSSYGYEGNRIYEMGSLYGEEAGTA